ERRRQPAEFKGASSPILSRTSMNPQDEKRDDEQLAALLGTVNRDAAPPDAEALRRAKELSAQAFLQAQNGPGRRLMFWTKMRIMVAASLALVFTLGSVIWFRNHLHKERAPDFATVMTDLYRSTNNHWQMDRDGKTSEIWFSSGTIRWDQPD